MPRTRVHNLNISLDGYAAGSLWPSHAATSRRRTSAKLTDGIALSYQLFRDRNNWYYSDSRVIPKPAPLRA